MPKKQTAPWTVFLQGMLLSFGLYVAMQLLLALLLVKAVLPEKICFPALLAACGLSALVGGLYCARRSALGTLSSSLIVTAGFAALVTAVGILCYDGITGRGGMLLVAALVGGILAGLFAGKRGRRIKQKRKQKKHL
ncbi:MAG: TIGR04086 family membrane protein [Oscillibacter sp.]